MTEILNMYKSDLFIMFNTKSSGRPCTGFQMGSLGFFQIWDLNEYSQRLDGKTGCLVDWDLDKYCKIFQRFWDGSSKLLAVEKGCRMDAQGFDWRLYHIARSILLLHWSWIEWPKSKNGRPFILGFNHVFCGGLTGSCLPKFNIPKTTQSESRYFFVIGE